MNDTEETLKRVQERIEKKFLKYALRDHKLRESIRQILLDEIRKAAPKKEKE
tara:strand:+ start:34576 stop:34731 length:156 start_codon:yes stop_codon:yes gene_type:complete